MQRYYWPQKNILVFTEKRSSPQYWEERWSAQHILKFVRKKDRFIINTTKKFLPKGSKVLEGGCGRGNKVYSLQMAGFDAFGIDYAPLTIKLVNEYAPDLNVREGDVRNLQFEDNFFDGYWSLGVIEHFFRGYETIASEMDRVLKPGGYLFLTFPCMNVLRLIKIKLGRYPVIGNDFDPEKDSFYQFALDVDKVIEIVSGFGFKLIRKQGRNGIKGFKDEVEIVRPFLQKVYDSNNLVIKVFKRLIDLVFAWWCGHSALLIFRKTS